MPTPFLSSATGLPAINAGLFAAASAAGVMPSPTTAAGGASAVSPFASQFASQFAGQLAQDRALAADPAAGITLAGLAPAAAASTTPGTAPVAAVGMASLIGVGVAPAVVADVEPPSASAPGLEAPTLSSESPPFPLPPGAVAVPTDLVGKPSKAPLGQEHTLPMPNPWTAPWRRAPQSAASDTPALPDEPGRGDEAASAAVPPAATDANAMPAVHNEPTAPAPETASDAGAQSMAAWIAQLLPPAASPASLPPSDGASAARGAKTGAVPATGAPDTAADDPLNVGSDGAVSAAVTSPPVPGAKSITLPVRDTAAPRRAESANTLPGASARADASRVGDSQETETTASGDTSETAPSVARDIALPDPAPAAPAAANPVPPGETPMASAVVPPPTAAGPNVTASPSDTGTGVQALAEADAAMRARRPEAAAPRREAVAGSASNSRADGPADRADPADRRPALSTPTTPTAEAALSTARDDSRPIDAESAHKPAFGHLLDAAHQAQASAQTTSANSAHIPASTAVDVSLPTPVLSPEFRDALGVQVSVLARDGVQHAELHLNPGDMGPISVRIALDGTQAQVDFGVDSAATRALVESGMPELASALREAGLTLTGGGVSQHPRGQAGDSPPGGRPGDGSQPGQPGGTRLRGGQGDDTNVPLPRPRTVRMAGGVDLYA